ncbi:Hypothetical predicted protein [Pelobates cultripes]|uniref:Uncharacterized protein n=1 Tax=Pelobates cultripes TaxID=61616 RepID=A0AAD1S289_PELCU|nr:Hypothetical predicted protein [Pelobates cultripes]
MWLQLAYNGSAWTMTTAMGAVASPKHYPNRGLHTKTSGIVPTPSISVYLYHDPPPLALSVCLGPCFSCCLCAWVPASRAVWGPLSLPLVLSGGLGPCLSCCLGPGSLPLVLSGGLCPCLSCCLGASVPASRAVWGPGSLPLVLSGGLGPCLSCFLGAWVPPCHCCFDFFVPPFCPHRSSTRETDDDDDGDGAVIVDAGEFCMSSSKVLSVCPLLEESLRDSRPGNILPERLLHSLSSPCMDLVLWSPPTSQIQKLLRSLTGLLDSSQEKPSPATHPIWVAREHVDNMEL